MRYGPALQFSGYRCCCLLGTARAQISARVLSFYISPRSQYFLLNVPPNNVPHVLRIQSEFTSSVFRQNINKK
jgi:hypothetical protein